MFHDYFNDYVPGSEASITLLQEKFGPNFEKMDYEDKAIFRAILCTYVASYEAYDHSESSDPDGLIDSCIEGAGQYWDVWDNGSLIEAVKACKYLHKKDLEALINALTEQINRQIYSSRGEVWL